MGRCWFFLTGGGGAKQTEIALRINTVEIYSLFQRIECERVEAE